MREIAIDLVEAILDTVVAALPGRLDMPRRSPKGAWDAFEKLFGRAG